MSGRPATGRRLLAAAGRLRVATVAVLWLLVIVMATRHHWAGAAGVAVVAVYRSVHLYMRWQFTTGSS